MNFRKPLMPYSMLDEWTAAISDCENNERALAEIEQMREMFQHLEDMLYDRMEGSPDWSHADVMRGHHTNEIETLATTFIPHFMKTINDFRIIDERFSEYEDWHDIKQELGL